MCWLVMKVYIEKYKRGQHHKETLDYMRKARLSVTENHRKFLTSGMLNCQSNI